MFKITDILSLGVSYNIEDDKGEVVKTIQIIPHTDILEAALGPYSPEFGSYSEYLVKSAKVLSGNEDIDITDILWLATYDEEVAIPTIIAKAVKQGCDIIILEHLEELE
jgi:hypothetical protein